ncbi:MAG: hypothetical protein OQJ89_14290 [Kangiellaceae bacterium]|nr:hypothetical protein [Kangiellaceae bacterium]MCW8998420.1 hypothetical protein [Kangiellaceae bacterium]MCW9018135.1 hypothetical protein [Kangiellaceae bacterium]
MNLRSIFVSLAVVLVFSACGGSDTQQEVTDPQDPTRSFKMGFTPWLYEASSEAQNVTYSRLAQHGDVIKHHLMSGIPWQEALDGSDYHANVEAEINGRLSRTPNNMDVFLAIDSLNTERDDLAPYWGETPNMPMPGEWANRSWSSPQVISAYVNYSLDMINRFQPTHFEYGTEISELILNDPAGYAEYIIFATSVYTAIKAIHPDLNLVTSIAIKSPGTSEMDLINAAIGEVLEFTDVVGISAYPYVFFNHEGKGDPANLPTNWLTQVNQVVAEKPLLISETGWIGENLTIEEFSVAIQSDPDKQSAYVQRVLESAQALDAQMVIWWTVSDFDILWQDTLAQDPTAKIWKDIGLYNEGQQARVGLGVWDNWFSYLYQE